MGTVSHALTPPLPMANSVTQTNILPGDLVAKNAAADLAAKLDARELSEKFQQDGDVKGLFPKRLIGQLLHCYGFFHSERLKRLKGVAPAALFLRCFANLVQLSPKSTWLPKAMKEAIILARLENPQDQARA